MTCPNPTDDGRPLCGVRVLDLSRVLAGPMCAQYLGDLGAEIIKVEAAERGDETRGWPPFRDGQSAIYLSVNRNKRSIAIDLKQADGQAIVKRLAQKADIVIENFGQTVAARLGVAYADLNPSNPKMVYCSISGFGRKGPLADAPAYDVAVQAFSGMMSLTGEPGGGPVRSPISPIDQATGMQAMAGALAALYRAARTGRGAFVEVSLLDTAFALLAYQLQSFWETGKQPEKNGSRHLSLCPYQAFEAQDGPFLLAISNDDQWKRFCFAAHRQDLAADPRYATNRDRVARYAETVGLIQEIIAADTREGWAARLKHAKVPCSPIHLLGEMMAHPQARASGAIVDYMHPSLGAMKTVATPIMIDEKARTAGGSPPAHGEHTGEILNDLGYSATEIEAMFETNLVAGQR